ncbi:hypothetical protein [Shewanella sp. FJAT-52076]|uniref:hypothetical protein n=1 Tax=Shewanella sp. FJAT-52076 TaxID=2864202 RepID=UPI001C65C3CF|nr:hypothetical protein [Shewanella sp. FJAT-52076]QYJ74050.1 hypothetical protein K0H79_11745 [Shewanella sp. FJAT-52076]
MSSLKSMKVLLPALIGLLLVLALEFVLQTPDEDDIKLPPMPVMPTLNTPNTLASQIPVRFIAAKEVESEHQPQVDVVDGRTEQAFQDAQHGLLKYLYIKDKRYRLSAVVNSQNRAAVLAVSTLEGQNEKYLSITQGEMLGPYQVAAIDERQITLTQANRQVLLSLFQSVAG